MKRFGGARHYLDSQAQSEQAAALKPTTLCRAVVCSYWLAIDRWGALLGELCSLPVRFESQRGTPLFTPEQSIDTGKGAGAAFLKER
jgi:hypothetical protein